MINMKYIVETKGTDGVGGWSEWSEVAMFKYRQDAVGWAKHVKSYQHEEAAIDRVQIRVMYEGIEVEIS